MNNYSEIHLVVMAVVFFIVLIVSYKSLAEMFGPDFKFRLVMAICVAALSVIGLSDMFAPPEESASATDSNAPLFKFNFILLPYLLLPFVILATLIIRLVMRLRRNSEMRKREKKYLHRKP